MADEEIFKQDESTEEAFSIKKTWNQILRNK